MAFPVRDGIDGADERGPEYKDGVERSSTLDT